MSLQFGRKIGLIAYNPPVLTANAAAPAGNNLVSTTLPGTTTPGAGLDLSDFRITFNISQSDYETPNLANIKVYNLGQNTKQSLKSEFQRITLQGGYDFPNGTGVIFDGDIRQVLFGNDSNVDSYVEIIAAEGDIAYNNAVCSASLAKGATNADQLAVILNSMQPYGVTKGYVPPALDSAPTTALSRGVVKFGLAKDQARALAASTNTSWSIQDGKLTFIPLTSYVPGEAVVLNSETGLIGFPVQTPGGINILTLLNPRVQIGSLVYVQPEDINQGVIANSGPILYGPGRLENLSSAAFIAKISGSGFYKVLVAEHDGDTRGVAWYSKLVCLAVDKSAPAGKEVQPYYAGSVSVGTPTIESAP